MRVAAEPIVAPENVPRVPYSESRGLALRSEQTAGASPETPVRFDIKVDVEALLKFGANQPLRPLDPGWAEYLPCAGLPLPGKADAIVPHPRRYDEGPALDSLVLTASIPSGEGALMPGQDYEAGTTLVRTGERITPEAQAILIAAGIRTLRVVKRPRIIVAVASCDLLPIDHAREAWQRPDSNGPYIRSLLQRWGYEVPAVEYLPLVNSWLPEPVSHSTFRQYVQELKRLVASYDLIIGTGMPERSIGGVSGLASCPGFLSPIPVQVAQRPGGLFSFGRSQDRSPPRSELRKHYRADGSAAALQRILYEDQAVLVNLPGFTSNVGVLMHMFVRRIVDELEHVSHPRPYWRTGKLSHEIGRDANTHRVLWGNAIVTSGGQITLCAPYPQPVEGLAALAKANALIAAPSGQGPLCAGTPVHYLSL
ncbi:Molybdopterin biosynthesis enzyme [Trinickia caryophylli]|uniref:Molybdopterin molybdenumtransferase n=2 Tax=Trinickia caryophylli TaxID=28094 RepID=A0A1X7FT95_TRICW|nr:Molybdopterin biosynthesis enzyme [Trinickia caryophylli]